VELAALGRKGRVVKSRRFGVEHLLDNDCIRIVTGQGSIVNERQLAAEN